MNRVILKSGQINERRSREKSVTILHTTGEGSLYLLSGEKRKGQELIILKLNTYYIVGRLGGLIAAWAIFI